MHQAAVSDEALAEWAAEREALRLAGDPDRPPDVRTGAMRAWQLRPDEPHACPAIGLDETPLAGWMAGHRLGVVGTLLVSRQPDGRVLLRYRAVRAGAIISDAEVQLTAEADIEPAVRPILARWTELGFEPPDVASAADFADAMRLVRRLDQVASTAARPRDRRLRRLAARRRGARPGPASTLVSGDCASSTRRRDNSPCGQATSGSEGAF